LLRGCRAFRHHAIHHSTTTLSLNEVNHCEDNGPKTSTRVGGGAFTQATANAAALPLQVVALFSGCLFGGICVAAPPRQWHKDKRCGPRGSATGQEGQDKSTQLSACSVGRYSHAYHRCVENPKIGPDTRSDVLSECPGWSSSKIMGPAQVQCCAAGSSWDLACTKQVQRILIRCKVGPA